MAKVIEERQSKYSGRIQVIKDVNGMRLVAGGLDQSGGAVVGVLKNAVSVADEVLRALVLGVGGGTVIGLIRKRFPGVNLTCVEIDLVMVELAGKYFGVVGDDKLQIVNEDAAEFVKNTEYRIQNTGGYDYILVDCYLGDQVPNQCEEGEFLQGVRKLLSDDGVVVFNRLFYDAETRRKAQEFIFKLEPVFPMIDLRRAGSNLLICCKSTDGNGWDIDRGG